MLSPDLDLINLLDDSVDQPLLSNKSSENSSEKNKTKLIETGNDGDYLRNSGTILDEVINSKNLPASPPFTKVSAIKMYKKTSTPLKKNNILIIPTINPDKTTSNTDKTMSNTDNTMINTDDTTSNAYNTTSNTDNTTSNTDNITINTDNTTGYTDNTTSYTNNTIHTRENATQKLARKDHTKSFLPRIKKRQKQ